jgi:hypothetical protein
MDDFVKFYLKKDFESTEVELIQKIYNSERLWKDILYIS